VWPLLRCSLGVNLIKLFYPPLMVELNKLECLSLASLESFDRMHTYLFIQGPVP
jgi:hypothetical protein